MLATVNTSVWLGTPYCGDTASRLPPGAAPARLMAIGPLQRPAPRTQDTWMAPLLATVNTSVWLGTPYCGEAASRPRRGRAGRTDGHRPVPPTSPLDPGHLTAPLLATVNTSVWLGTPYCGETARWPPGVWPRRGNRRHGVGRFEGGRGRRSWWP